MKEVCKKIRAVQIRSQADELLHMHQLNNRARYEIFQDDEDRLMSDDEIRLIKLVEREVMPLYLQAAPMFQ
jgi:hypothetical protein